MTLTRMARRFAVVLVLSTAVARSAAADQDALSRAKELYASAAYDEALAVLDQIPPDPASSDANEVREYRAFCLLALGRSDDGRRVIETIVESNPLFQPSDDQASPRLRAVFQDVRRQRLPRVVRKLYADAKAAFDKNEMKAAATGFDRVLVLLDDPDSTDAESTSDLRMLATGFRDLSKAAAPTKAAAPPSAPGPAAPEERRPGAPSSEPVKESANSRRTYGPGDVDVTAPVALSQPVPAWRPPKMSGVRREYQGALVVVIDERGAVESAALLERVQPDYDAALLAAARQWKFKAALKDGTPVRYRKVVGIHLLPPD